MRRVGLVVTAALCFLVAFEQPAAAHGAGGVEATNFETTIDGLTPDPPGVRVRLVDTGDRVELRNDGAEVVVLGVQGEPYLRVGRSGTFESRTSPTADLNRRRMHDAVTVGAPTAPAPPSQPDPAGPPEWRKLSDSPVARWHDHRIHWMAARNPAQVEAAPRQRHVVYPRWEIGLQQGDVRSVVFGRLTWVPGPSPAPWFGIMAGAFLVTTSLGLLRRWGRPLAAATVLVLALDVVHATSVAFSFAGGLGTHLAKVVTGSFYGMVGWVLAALAIRLLVRGKVDGLYAGVFAGLSIALFGGLLDLATLSRTVTPSALPIDVARLCIAITAGAGLGIAAACLLVIQRTPDARRVVGGRSDHESDGDALDEGGGARDVPTAGPRSEGPDRLTVGSRVEPQP